MNEQNDIKLHQIAEVLKQERLNLLRYACYRLGDKSDAEDALQDLFLKLYSRLSNHEMQIQNLKSYIFGSLSNLCSSRLSLSTHLNTIPLDTRFDKADTTVNEYEDDYERIVILLKRIPEEQAEVIRLRIYGNNSFAEIAEILSLPLPTVKSRFLYGLDKLRRLMKPTKQ